MQNFTKKTTILFSPDMYTQLKELATLYKTSVAQLIRQAVIERYLLSDKKRRLKAVKELAKIGGLTSDLATMEKEIISAKVSDIL